MGLVQKHLSYWPHLSVRVVGSPFQGHSLSIAFFHARSQVFHDKQQQWAGDPTHKCKKEDRAMALQLAGPIATDLAFT